MQISAADDVEWWTDKRIIIIINERHATFPSNICFKCLSCMRPGRGISTSFSRATFALGTGSVLRWTHNTPYTVDSIEIYSAFLDSHSTNGEAEEEDRLHRMTVTSLGYNNNRSMYSDLRVSPNCDNYCSKTTDSAEERAAEETCRKSSALRVNSRPDDWSLVGHGVQEINKYLMRKWLDKRCSLVAG